ncbi:MAG: multidrug ABC transporter substrate-binding protein [Alphaproteobacteria bacterium RIFCSPLOWO2_01_FULL_40_26]|nr:MAG: multidrug ABC transporter substrate-binding protein [Alphaproteobacteria bacterium RIFCSPHIGHO2_02_FULL_40_34]OFW94559.1 MAG: multidrug ABC transporter substrate-binding protein [Alphaproteobacteria bacterium RIFCSPLOWO2_01_FULL_40_26]OFX10309.1 MAG: multidrug ABC transporter substrate-binding protein [Alphaproteobacteria bacterium RIFCSPLOWO2_02_FULL_40_19]OFX11909.1 MAG: multidrug ABC transporter substrate-binding protein [Alphaproteobacteria bacterium RIFCSPLOWO2_12_FULL_40_11]
MFDKLVLEFLIAFRYLKSKRKEGFISVIAIFSFIGIMIGVATLIIVMSVMNGFRYELINRILGINAHLTVYSHNHQIADYEKILAQIKEIPGVKFANALIESQAMLSSPDKNIGGLIRGIKIDDLKNKTLIAKNITAGDLGKLSKRDVVVVGSAVAQNLNLRIGDPLKIISAETNQSIIGTIPRIKTYEVAGVFDSGMYEYDSTMVFMNFEMAQIHFRFPNSVSAIEIFAKDATKLDEIKEQLFQILAHGQNLYMTDWQQANSGFIDALKVESTVMFLILTLIILVAAFNIISSMIMLVNDKNKNIALLRTLGMSKSSVMRIFLICGSSIGVIGTLLGLTIGVLFSANIDAIKRWLESITDTSLFNPTIYFLSTLPSKIFVSDVILITGMTLILSFLATLYPAYKASKSNPAEILRYE